MAGVFQPNVFQINVFQQDAGYFADAEKACLHQELRTAYAAPESWTAIVPFEDRVYQTSAEQPEATISQPRKRIC